jgi:hypothetical protein
MDIEKEPGVGVMIDVYEETVERPRAVQQRREKMQR